MNRKNSRCTKKSTNARKKTKTAVDVGVMIHRLHASNDRVYEAAEDLVNSRRKYHENYLELQRLLAEKEEIRKDLYHRRNSLQEVTSDMEKAVTDLKTIDGSKISDQDAAAVELNLWLTEEDVVVARKHIKFADNDLNDEDTGDKTSTAKLTTKVLNSLAIPNVMSNGIVQMNGSININRNKCCICVDRRINAVLNKCGHFCLCFECASELMKLSSEDKKCPICRKDIEDVIQTYLV